MPLTNVLCGIKKKPILTFIIMTFQKSNLDEFLNSKCTDTVCQTWTDKVMEIALRTIKQKIVAIHEKINLGTQSRL